MEKKSNLNKIILITVVVVLIILAGVAGYMIINKNSEEKNNQDKNVSENSIGTNYTNNEGTNNSFVENNQTVQRNTITDGKGNVIAEPIDNPLDDKPGSSISTPSEGNDKDYVQNSISTQ